MSYVLEFEIAGLPRMANQQLRSHWRVKHGHARTWKAKVMAIASLRAPPEPLKRARLTLTRCSAKEPDTDGLISGFKHIIDALVIARVIEDDKPSNIGIPAYRWERAPMKRGHVKIKVEASA